MPLIFDFAVAVDSDFAFDRAVVAATVARALRARFSVGVFALASI
ncbi:MAG TPA: hypothetical protein VJS43_04070 [Candidatus Acidoferrales bacterium]|nr:hypothetical protein [Candidatus Acidoferrales bacterium]